MMDIRPWLQELYAPVVLVAATPAAEAVVQAKNGIGLNDLLRPYSSVYQLNVPVRVGEAVIRVQDLRVRFHDAATMYQPPPEVIEDHLQEVLKAASQRHANLDPSPELLQRVISDKPPDMRELTPWFTAYRSEFLRMLRFGDHETLDYPVACVYAIPADVVNPASHFDTLVAQLVLPPLMQQDVMYTLRDKDFPRHYVLLLDVVAGMSEKRALDNLAAIRKLYGEAHCSLLRINTGNGDRAHSGAPPDFFARYQHACVPGGGAGEPLARPPAPPGGVGAYLTAQDLEAVGSFVRDFISRTLLPRLGDRISRLNASITAARRGLRNRLNRFWKGTAEDRQTDRPYPWHSVEGQMRQLGDLAFLLRQYAFAESTYRLAAQDYLAEGNSKWYAGVEEMIGLCTVLGEPSDPIAAVLLQNDPIKYFMRAYEHYTKPPATALTPGPSGPGGWSGPYQPGSAGGSIAASGGGQMAGPGAAAGAPQQLPPAAVAATKLGRMLATRVVLLGAAVHSAAGRHRASSEALMRAQSEEENARAGLMLEQSAYAMLYCRPPLMRKFAFQMVLAGIRYICCSQKRIAIHAYRQVLALYLGRKWRYIEEHLHAVLGAQCVEYGDKERALWHYCSLLDCGHRPAAQQASNVAQFLNLLAAGRDQLAVTQDGASLVDRLPLPLVNRHDVRVLCSDCACYAGPAARTVPDSTWLKMESCCTSGSNNWLVDGGTKQEKDHEEYTRCVCGEEVSVQVEFRNPLAVKLKLTNVQLICTFTLEGDAAAGPATTPPTTPPAAPGSMSAAVQVVDGQHPLLPGSALAGISNQPASEYLHIPEAQFALHPGEALVEVLRVVPRAPGWLQITGVTWTLNGVAHGRIAFDVKGRRRKRPKGNRPGQLKHFPPHRRLLFQVVSAMPRLELMDDPLPPVLYSGELCRVLMRVRNSGGLPLRSLALVVGHPEAVCPATDVNKDRPLLESLTDLREEVQLCSLPASVRSSLQLYRLWPGRELAPGDVLEWPLWIHPRGVGTLKLPMVWYGEPVMSKGTMRHRTLRVCGTVSVQPLLASRPAVWPSPTHLSHHLLRLTIDNSKDAERVVLQQVAAVTVPATHKTPSVSGTTTAIKNTTPAGGGGSGGNGWRIALLGSQSSSSSPGGSAGNTGSIPETSFSPSGLAVGANTDFSVPTTAITTSTTTSSNNSSTNKSNAAGPGPGSTPSAVVHPSCLPLFMPLQPGETGSLFLQLIAPPPQSLVPVTTAAAAATQQQNSKPGVAAAGIPFAAAVAAGQLNNELPHSAATRGSSSSGASASAGHDRETTTPRVAPPPNADGGGGGGTGLTGDNTRPTAVVAAAEAMRSLALTDPADVGPSGRRLPSVDGSDSSLQQLNLFGPGILAHFYRRSRRGMFAVTGSSGAASSTTIAAAAGPHGTPAAPRGGAAATPPAAAVSGGAGVLSPPHANHHGGPAPPHPLPLPLMPAVNSNNLTTSMSFGPSQSSGSFSTFLSMPPALNYPHPGVSAPGGPLVKSSYGSFTTPSATSLGHQTGSSNISSSSASSYGAHPAASFHASATGLATSTHPTATAAAHPGGRAGPPGARQAATPAAVVAAPTPGGSGPGRPGTHVPLADPPVDLLLLWHVAASQRTGPHHGQQRLGLCRPFDPQTGRDLSGCLQAHTTPVRMLLTGPNGASSAANVAGSAGPSIRHDFRRSTLAVVPLRLALRNNTGVEARLQIEVGDGWQSTDVPHSWQASTAILNHPPGTTALTHQQPPGSNHSMMGPAGANPGGAMGPGGMPLGPLNSSATGGSVGTGGGQYGAAGMGLGGSMMAITYQAGLPPCPEYSWVGPSFATVPKVEPGGEVEVALAVAVFRPGAYCITGHRCTAFLEALGTMEVQRGEPLCFRVEG